jgi:hypothetical protein
VSKIAENASAGEVDLSPEIFDAISKIAAPGIAPRANAVEQIKSLTILRCGFYTYQG